jgi:hypothetical protein
MSRIIPIVPEFRMVEAKGLRPPVHDPRCHWSKWQEDQTRKTPFVIRISWLPMTGQAYIGVQVSHALQIPRDRRYPLGAYLRAFWFPSPPVLALRPYFWPENFRAAWDHDDAELNERITLVFLALVQPHIPLRTRIFKDIDNHFLRQTFPQQRNW